MVEDPGHGAQPDAEYFALMADIAEDHWWYRARRRWLADAVAGRVRPGAVALDVGTGTGEALTVLRDAGAGLAAGTDLSTDALHAARTRVPPPPVLRSVAEHLPFADGAAQTLISMDVIEHLDDDVAALTEYRRVLEPGGVVVITVPAYQWLWSEHDVRAAHRRRYTRPQLLAALAAAGFAVERSTYLFSFLVPPAALLRRTPLRRLVTATDDEVSSGHPAVDAALAGLAWAERAVARLLRIRLPFGLSILAVARAPGGPCESVTAPVRGAARSRC